MATPLNLTSNIFIIIFTAALLYIAHTIPHLHPPPPTPLKQTSLVFYVHDSFSAADATAVTVAGASGADSSILRFGTIAAVDDPVTDGPSPHSAEIGRAQGIYVNSQLDGKALHMVFSVVFTEGDYRGSTLEIQGADAFEMKKREFGVISGTGYFRFVKGFGIMETEFMDLANLRATLKLNVTVKHY